MPYKNIVYAKLEKRLLEDPRWYMLSETSQLNYIKLILTAQATYNRIPTQLEAIRKAFKTNQRLKTLELSLIEIQNAFPKFKKSENFYYFEEFEEKTNYIRANPSNAEGLPKEGTDKEEEKEKEKDKEEEKEKISLVLNSWNSFADMLNLKKIIKLSDTRIAGIRQRAKEKEFDLDMIFEKIRQSKFLLGENDRGWKVDFDFVFCSKTKYLKILEGKYDGTNKNNGGASPEELAAIVARRFAREQEGN